MVLHVLWAVITVVGTITTFSHTAASPLAFVGGLFGLLAVGAGVVGIGNAVKAPRAEELRPARRLAIAYASLAAAFLFLIVTAGFDMAATG